MIIIPTYNERKNIRPLVDRIRTNLSEIRILFVDDSSPDGTSDEIKNLQETDKNIFLLTRPAKAGFASAYLDGFRHALEKFNPEFIITMDGDLSHPAEILPELIKITQADKIAVGSRYITGGGVKNWKMQRRILSKFANFYARVLAELHLRDVTSGFMAMPNAKLKQLDFDSIQSRGYAFLMELKHNLAKLGNEFVEIPIIFEERREGVSKIGSGIIIEGIKYPARLFWDRQVNKNYIAWGIFLVSLLVYVVTLPHSIFFGDSAEFISSAASLGIPHPPGYPTYVLLAKLFTFFPFGSTEFRVGLFSALSASTALVVFYHLFLKIANFIYSEYQEINQRAALVAVFILGFSHLFWSQAIMAKVYTPMLLVLLIIFLLMAKFWETGKLYYFGLAMFLFGVGAGLHQMILLFLPVVILAALIYLFDIPDIFKQRFQLKPFFVGVGLLVLGLLVFGYLPLRAHASGNFFDFSKIFRTSNPGQSITGFIDYVIRSDYADYGGKFLWAEKVGYLNSFLSNLWAQFYWFLILLPVGLIQLWLSSKRFFVLIAGTLVINVLGIILLRTAPLGYENEFLYSFYYLPAYTMVVFCIGLGVLALVKLARDRVNPGFLDLFFLILLGAGYLLFNFNYSSVNLSKFKYVDQYSTAVLQSLPTNAVLLTYYSGAATDTVTFGLHYQQIIKHLRPDVTILTTSDIYPEAARNVVSAVFELKDPAKARYHLLNYVLKEPEYKNRPIYTTYIADDLTKKVAWTSVSNGLVYKFSLTLPVKFDETYHEVNPDQDLKILTSDMFGQDLLAQYKYAQAAFWAGQKDLAKTQSNFIEAIKYDYRVMGGDEKLFMFYRSRIFGKL